MIFTPRNVEAILLGNKTMTRRPINPVAPSRRRGKARYVADCRYKVGRTYALQAGRGKPGCAHRLRIRSVRPALLHETSLRDARAEGFETRKAFFDYWRLLHGEADRSQWVWVIRFSVVGPPYHPRCLSDAWPS